MCMNELNCSVLGKYACHIIQKLTEKCNSYFYVILNVICDLQGSSDTIIRVLGTIASIG